MSSMSYAVISVNIDFEPNAWMEHINRPAEVIQRLFEENGGQADEDFEEKVASHFQEAVKSQQIEVPHLQALHRDAPVGTLVRFRCMVQDTVADDIYASTSSDESKCTIWQEATPEGVGETTDYSRFRQRQLLYCTEVPCETDWARQELYGSAAVAASLAQMSISDESSTAKSHTTAIEKRFVPHAPHVGALVKLWADGDSPRPTDIIDVVGIYEQTSWSPCASIDPSEDSGDPLPPVPCIYAIFWKPVELSPLSGGLGDDWLSVRSTVLAELARTVGGDTDAAEWLLLHVISGTYSRRASLALGNFPLNLALPQGSRVEDLERVMRSLLPALRVLRVELATLNKATAPWYSPRSIDENLEAGALQLTAGTHILADETQMKEGKLNDKGVRDVRALATVISSQAIDYVFPFSQFSFQTDLPVLVISQGKSLFQVPIVVAVQPSGLTPSTHTPTSDELYAWRSAVRHLKSADLQIPESMVQYIESDFVKTRQSNQAFSQDDLSLRMTTARLMALSLGKKDLDEEAWQRTVELDERRRARLIPGSKT